MLCCIIAFLAEAQVCAYAYCASHRVVHEPVFASPLVAECVHVHYFSVNVDSSNSSPQASYLLNRQRFSELKQLATQDSWAKNRGNLNILGEPCGQTRNQWIFPETDISPMPNAEGRSLPCIFYLNNCSWTSPWIPYLSAARYKYLPWKNRNRVGDIKNRSRFTKYVRSQLPLVRLIHLNQLESINYQNADSHAHAQPSNNEIKFVVLGLVRWSPGLRQTVKTLLAVR